MQSNIKILLTLVVVVIAVGAVGFRYLDYLRNPWTRDGQVRANVIKVAPRVSGPVVDLPIIDNQLVEAGTLLFKIDPRTYEAAFRQASAELDQTVDQLKALDEQVDAAAAQVKQAKSVITQAETQVRSAEAQLTVTKKDLDRFTALLKNGNISQARVDAARRDYDVSADSKARAEAALVQARSALLEAEANLAAVTASRGVQGEDNPRLRAARAALEQARLNMEFTEQRASVDGYVANLELRLGSQANADQPAMALIDVNSFWVDAYFRESEVGYIKKGYPAFVTLMSYPDQVIPAEVESVGWGISRSDGSTGADLLPEVQATYEWIRLAQRIPVRIKIGELPEGVSLRVGTTASVLVRTDGGKELSVPAPSLLQ